MSAMLRDFLAAQEGARYLSALEPFSPSVFLDLLPTPGRPADPTDDDLVLPFISRMLMEEDIDDKFFYQFPDHPALLNAQQPYAQILSDSSPSDDSSYAATNTTATTTISSSGSGPAAATPPSRPPPMPPCPPLTSPPPSSRTGGGNSTFS